MTKALVALLVVAAQYKVVPDSSAQFVARITGGSFTGATKDVSGTVRVGDDNKVAEGIVTIKADSLDTGMSMRNSHMKEKYLETGKFPTMTLDLAGAVLPPNAVGTADVNAVLELHGVKKPLTLHVTIVDTGNGQRRATSNFSVDITDFGIAQPKFTVVKMDTKVDVSVDVRFAAAQ